MKEIREKAGKSLMETAILLGVHPNTVWAKEDESASVTLRSINDLADAVGVTAKIKLS